MNVSLSYVWHCWLREGKIADANEFISFIGIDLKFNAVVINFTKISTMFLKSVYAA